MRTLDRDDISWGQQWSTRLRTETEATTFLLSIVTPRYLTSPACREELLNFATAADKAQEPKLLLPLQWIDISDTDVVADTDPVLKKIRQTQWHDAQEVRRIEPGSIQYEQFLEGVARSLRQTIENRANTLTPDSILRTEKAGDDRDLLDAQLALEERKEPFEAAVADFKAALGGIGAVFQGRPPLNMSHTYGAARALSELGDELRLPVENLDKATAHLGSIWQEYDSGISRATLILSEFPDPATRRTVFESLDGLANTLEVPGAEAMEQQLRGLGDASRHLRPMSRAFSSALQLIRGIQTSARAWRDRV